MTTPPLRARVLFWLFGTRVPRESGAWAEDQILHARWWHPNLGFLLGIALFWVALDVFTDVAGFTAYMGLALFPGFIVVTRLLPRRSPIWDRWRAQFISYQRGERGYPWHGPLEDQSVTWPMIALAASVAIAVTVALLLTVGP